ncbi:MAG: YraN family protein, partial [Colwellia sp.]
MLWNKNASAKDTSSTDKGKMTESYAQQYLSKQGLILIERNFHSRQGEIDLIMLDGDTYVFVEVKYRKSKRFGGAIAAISASKQKK